LKILLYQQLGIGNANLLNEINSDEIVLGGSAVRAATFLLPEIERVVKRRELLNNKQTSI
jgi:N-acetylglucosamine repressor